MSQLDQANTTIHQHLGFLFKKKAVFSALTSFKAEYKTKPLILILNTKDEYKTKPLISILYVFRSSVRFGVADVSNVSPASSEPN